MTQVNQIIFLTLISKPFLFPHILNTGNHGVGEIYYFIGFIIRKSNGILLYFLLFTLLVSTLTVKDPHILIIIAINTPFVPLLVSVTVNVVIFYTLRITGLLVTHSGSSLVRF